MLRRQLDGHCGLKILFLGPRHPDSRLFSGILAAKPEFPRAI